MTWIKQGVIFNKQQHTHAQVPTPLIIDDYIQIYYADRKNGMAYPAFFNLDKDLKTILRHSKRPAMEHGKPGMFDSDGIMPSCVYRHEGKLLLQYIGWNEKSKTARYHNEIGLAISNNGGESFTRVFDGPIIGRSTNEPGLAVMPFTMYKNWFRMWYQSGTSWEKVGSKYEPVYVIKYAESVDGIKWGRYGQQCIQSSYPLEAFSRPSVVFRDGIYHMWFCYRNSKNYRGGKGSYRIGYAQSTDGHNFKRMDKKSGISLGKKGSFDSTMQCYPYVFEFDGKLLMLYNGNRFGQTGIGLAVWKGDLPC